MTIRTVDEELVGKVADAICAEARRLQERGHSPEISGVQAENFARAAIEASGLEQLSNRVERLTNLLDEAFDFLGGCDGASEIRDRILRTRSGEHQLPRDSDRGDER